MGAEEVLILAVCSHLQQQFKSREKEPAREMAALQLLA